MSVMVHKVILQNNEHYGRKLPPQHLGMLFVELPQAIRATVSMAFRNRSHVKGRRPGWLDRAADVRFVGHEGNGKSVLYFEAPQLGEAAAEMYAQPSLFPDTDDRPDKDDTAFDVFGDVLNDVQTRNADSEHYDPSLLDRITQFNRVFKKGPYSEVDFTSRRFPEETPARLTPELVESAKSLLGRTPSPRRVRIVGQLDGLAASTQRFSVLLDSGEKVTGNFADDQVDAMQKLWRQRVVVLGRAIYRASGRLLRIDAEAVKPGDNERTIFSRMPSPPGTRIDTARLRKPQGAKSGINAVIGKWPGKETEQEITAILEELS
jgi:hypothetical protein